MVVVPYFGEKSLELEILLKHHWYSSGMASSIQSAALLQRQIDFASECALVNMHRISASEPAETRDKRCKIDETVKIANNKADKIF